MGDPKKLRKKYATPRHPWNKIAIETEKVIVKDYGLGKKQEIMIANSFLKKYKYIAKKLIASQTAQSEVEKVQVLGKLQGLGLLTMDAELDQILALDVKSILNRRIQSVLFRKGLARTMRQARQFIVHRHVAIGDKEITFPSYLISLEEETHLNFRGKSTLSNEDHPERKNQAKEIHKEAEAVKPIKTEKVESAKELEDIAMSEKELEEVQVE
ncbi:30S ribosomal protein S4 [Candidatus Woesearchaeota archaeon CG10_big_fil_rev_8_21_14_0_10_32_24]|nr:MAG: 30S ribosomal protein S4 [Candidatus Woesearchaeota archaeon CG10_big_fil_rev_8_21_14_0_10_32_24]